MTNACTLVHWVVSYESSQDCFNIVTDDAMGNRMGFTDNVFGCSKIAIIIIVFRNKFANFEPPATDGKNHESWDMKLESPIESDDYT